MTSDKDERRHDLTVEIDAPVEAVWRALTDAEELVRWFCLEARVKPGVNGRIWASWGPDCEDEEGTRISVWEPNRHLQTPWGDWAPGHVIDYFLEGRDGKTVLRLVHSGFGPGGQWDDEYESTRTGWALFLRNLRRALEWHPGVPCTTTVVTVPIGMSVKEGWSRLMSPNGLLREGTLDGTSMGGAYEVRTVTGETLRGVVDLWDPPMQLAATLADLNDALVGISFNYYGLDPAAVSVELRTYGVPPSRVDEARTQWETLLKTVYPPS